MTKSIVASDYHMAFTRTWKPHLGWGNVRFVVVDNQRANRQFRRLVALSRLGCTHADDDTRQWLSRPEPAFRAEAGGYGDPQVLTLSSVNWRTRLEMAGSTGSRSMLLAP